MEKIKIVVDRDFEVILPRYIKARLNEIMTLKEKLTQHDFDRIAAIGHKIKGSGGGYELDTLSEIGEKIEKAAKQEDEKELEIIFDEMSSYLENLDIVYE